MRAASFATLAAGLVLLAPPSASAQVPLETRAGLELLTSGFDASTANAQGVGSRGWGAQLNVEVSAFRVLMARADVGAFSVKDKRSFTEGTTQGDLASSTGGELGTLAAGLRTPPLALGEGKTALQLSASAAAGHTWIAAKRSIDRCIDCTVEDVEMDGGDFWEAGLEAGPRDRWAITARYRTYREASDFRDAVLVGWSMRIGRRSAAPRDEPAGSSAPVP